MNERADRIAVTSGGASGLMLVRWCFASSDVTRLALGAARLVQWLKI